MRARLRLPLFLLLAVLLGAAAPPAPPYPALGREIEAIVGRDFYDPERAARWVRENAGYAEGIADAEAFRRETRRRLALLGASHTEYYSLDDPGRWDLASLFESYLQQRFGAIQPTDDELREYYREHAAEFSQGAVVRPFEEAREVVKAALVAERRAAMVRDWLTDLRRRANVNVLLR